MSREIALLALEQSRAPTPEARLVLATFGLHADTRSRDTWVSPVRVSQLVEQRKDRVYEQIRFLEEIGELLPTGRKVGRTAVRRVLPHLEDERSRRGDGSVGAADTNPKNPMREGDLPSKERTQNGIRRVPVARVSAEAREVWLRLRAALDERLTEYAIHCWVDPLAVRRLEGGVLTVWAPRHIEAWVRQRYLSVLREAGGELGLDGVELDGDPAEVWAPRWS